LVIELLPHVARAVVGRPVRQHETRTENIVRRQGQKAVEGGA
jgi:hypothetical protein